MGVDAWIAAQLHPERIDDASLEATLARFPTLTRSGADLLREFPPPARVRAQLARAARTAGDSGAVRMTERHLAHDPPDAGEVAAMLEDIDRQLASLDLPSGVTVVGTAGTATTIAAIDLGLLSYDAAKVTGLRLDPHVVARQLERLLAMTVAQRRVMRGMEPPRADVIAGGVAIYARLLDRVGAHVFITCDRGIRWGLAHEQLSTAR